MLTECRTVTMLHKNRRSRLVTAYLNLGTSRSGFYKKQTQNQPWDNFLSGVIHDMAADGYRFHCHIDRVYIFYKV